MKFTSLLLVLVAVAGAEWIDFGTTDMGQASLNVMETLSTGFTVELTVPGMTRIPTVQNGILFDALSVPAMTPYAEKDGAPLLPKASFMAAVPLGIEPTITIEYMSPQLFFEGTKPYPMQPITAESSYDPVPFTYDIPSYSQGSYPTENVVFEESGTIRGVTLGRFTILPFEWTAENDLLAVYPVVRISVDFNQPLDFDQRLNSRFFSNTFKTLINSEQLGSPERVISASSCQPVTALNRREANDITAADFLVLAGDDFVETMMDEFLTAKMQQGYLTAAVAAGSWSTTEIWDYIKNAYNTWDVPPSFVLFVGDSDDIAPIALSYSYTDSVWADNRYLCMDGANDYQSDIFYGRIPSNTDFYNIVEDKILKWEFDPILESAFWNNGLCAGMLQANGGTVADRWFCFTCETVRDTYQNIYGKTFTREYVKDTTASPPYYYRSDLPSAGQQIPSDIVWDGDAEGILSRVNEGVFLVQHRDHGSIDGWGDPSFHNSDLAGLSNGDKTPMVMSVNCLTGKFVSDCFVENFLCMEGGAVGLLAATAVSYSYWNDYLCYGFYKSFNDEYTSPPVIYTNPTGNYLTGQAVMCGKIEMETSAPWCPYTTDRSDIEWDMFQWFGDPTMDMRTDVPHSLTVAAPYPLPSGATTALFNVTDSQGPVENALVCMQHPSGLWASGLTNAGGAVTLSFEPVGALQDITYMVTAHNALPFEGIINGVGIEDMTAGISTASVGSPYPNPATSAVSFPMVLVGAGEVSISVYDIMGRTVHTIESGELTSGSHELLWDVSEIPQGVYMTRIAGPAGNVETRRIIVAR